MRYNIKSNMLDMQSRLCVEVGFIYYLAYYVVRTIYNITKQVGIYLAAILYPILGIFD